MDRGEFLKPAGALVAAGAVLIGGVACTSETDPTHERKTAQSDEGRQYAGGIASEALPMTDQDLFNADPNEFNCGGHLRNQAEPLNQSFMIDYLSGHPDMAQDRINWFDQSLGKDAVDVLIARGVRSGATPEDKQIPGQPRLSEFTKALRAVQLSETEVFANFTCTPKTRRAGGKPTIAIPAGNHVEAILLDDAGFAAFMEKVNKTADGQLPVVIKGVTLDKAQFFAIYLEAFGCGNPIKPLTPPTPGKPGTPVTSSPPGMPPMTVTIPGPRDKKPKQRDHDARPQPGGGGEADPGMDPGNDGEDGFGPIDPHHPVDQTTSPDRTVPPSPNTTGAPRRPENSTPATTDAPRPVETSPPLGD